MPAEMYKRYLLPTLEITYIITGQEDDYFFVLDYPYS